MHFLLALLSALLDAIVGLVAPPVCAACPARVPRTRAFCAACAASLDPAPMDSDAIHAAFAYGGALRSAIRAFKYGGRADLARPLGHLLRGRLRAVPIRADVVVPVPLHPRRRADRGYDQAALLARHVARELQIRCEPAWLERIAHGPAQVTLDRAERLRGAALKFAAPRRLDGLRVLLVDDVVTTGATTRACRAVLVAAGAAQVVVLALARTSSDDAVER